MAQIFSKVFLTRVITVMAIASGFEVADAQVSAAGDGGAATSATANDVPADPLQEVLVTAQRRTQNVQDIGIAITAFSGPTLVEEGISNSADLGRITPGVFVSGSAAGGRGLHR